jgi:hypothetical protein
LSDEKLVDPNAEVKRESAWRTRRSFLVAGLGAVGGYEFYRWIDHAKQDEMLAKPLRKAFNFDAKISHATFGDRGLTPTYPVEKSVELRVNGNYGLKQELVPASYRLQVVGVENAKGYKQYVDDVTAWDYKYQAAEGAYEGHDVKVNPKDEAKTAAPQGTAKFMEPAGAPTPAGNKPAAAGDTNVQEMFAKAFAQMKAENGGRPPRGNEEAGESDSTLDPGTPGLLLSLDDVTKLPTQELVTQFKCIEGWSEIVHWAGVPLRDFIAAYPPARNAQGRLPKYVYMETPEGDYYCGFHLDDCLHPQSTLVTAMAGKPLTQWHGAPLRLHMPIKYGYKQIKRIALIAYTDDKPDDYWTKLGYDWYAGI